MSHRWCGLSVSSACRVTNHVVQAFRPTYVRVTQEIKSLGHPPGNRVSSPVYPHIPTNSQVYSGEHNGSSPVCPRIC
jgi:hypothetical protein